MSRRILLTLFFPLILYAPLVGQGVPSPVSHFGHEMGAHRELANWEELLSYYEKVALGSDRVRVDTLGSSTLGRPFVMLTITSPENHARLEELREIQLRLADPRRVNGEEELRRLLRDGRTVVLVTHGIHATEVGGPQMTPRLFHRLATSDDPGVLHILDQVILLDIPSLNPDGAQWIADWYDRWVGTEYEASPLPWLYHFYTGHDNNRDWYAFTQVETRLTVMKAHNAWHPQIVHDIHQMGSTGARIFFPPYIDPFDRNVDPGIITAVNQLGTYMAAEVTAGGKRGVVVGAIYDGFTPARAYQHYHGGARILSETASARLATPLLLDVGDLRGRRGFDAATSSWNFPWPWEGGEWGLPDIVDYMEAGVLALLRNAARNRPFWLENFYRINERAVEKWDTWPEAWIIPGNQENEAGLSYVLRILTMGDVEVRRATAPFRALGRRFPEGSWIVPMNQPYAAFAQTMLEIQVYPDLREYPGGPPRRPYDVTAHTLGLLMDVETVPLEALPAIPLSDPVEIPEWSFTPPGGLAGPDATRVGVYKSWQEPIPEGWTRWVLDQHGIAYDTIHDARMRAGDLESDLDVLLFQTQDPASIREGWEEGEVPPEYTGGLGPEGVRAVESFVRNGGRVVAVEDATDFVIDLFDLNVSNAVERLPPEDFYVPGSIVRVNLEEDHYVTRGQGDSTPAWYWRSSRAFAVGDPTIRVVARYGDGNPLLSGWLLGPEYLAGQPAIVEAEVGAGSVLLFGFQPNYRAQSVTTWPLLFNALAGDEPGAPRVHP